MNKNEIIAMLNSVDVDVVQKFMEHELIKNLGRVTSSDFSMAELCQINCQLFYKTLRVILRNDGSSKAITVAPADLVLLLDVEKEKLASALMYTVVWANFLEMGTSALGLGDGVNDIVKDLDADEAHYLLGLAVSEIEKVPEMVIMLYFIVCSLDNELKINVLDEAFFKKLLVATNRHKEFLSAGQLRVMLYKLAMLSADMPAIVIPMLWHLGDAQNNDIQPKVISLFKKKADDVNDVEEMRPFLEMIRHNEYPVDLKLMVLQILAEKVTSSSEYNMILKETYLVVRDYQLMNHQYCLPKDLCWIFWALATVKDGYFARYALFGIEKLLHSDGDDMEYWLDLADYAKVSPAVQELADMALDIAMQMPMPKSDKLSRTEIYQKFCNTPLANCYHLNMVLVLRLGSCYELFNEKRRAFIDQVWANAVEALQLLHKSRQHSSLSFILKNAEKLDFHSSEWMEDKLSCLYDLGRQSLGQDTRSVVCFCRKQRLEMPKLSADWLEYYEQEAALLKELGL